MEDKFVKFNESADWSNYTIIFPCVSVGNIGQLAVDLLISSLPNTQKCGYLISSLVQPIVGYDAYLQNSTELSLSCDLYENKAHQLIFLQQRAPLFKGKRNKFVELLNQFMKKENFKDIICLTSSHAYERLDSQLFGIQCRYLSSNKQESNILTEKLGWKRLERRQDHNHNNVSELDSLDSFIPGGGIAQKFYKISQENNLNSYILLVFAHEGNNIPEAMQLASFLNEWKQYLTKSTSSMQLPWRIPISWTHLFGQSLDPDTQSQIF